MTGETTRRRIRHRRYGAGWSEDRPGPIAGSVRARFDGEIADRTVLARDCRSEARPVPVLAVADGRALARSGAAQVEEARP